MTSKVAGSLALVALAVVSSILATVAGAPSSTAATDAGMTEALVFPSEDAGDAHGLVNEVETGTDLELDWVLGLSDRSHLVATIADETTLRFNVSGPGRANANWEQPTTAMEGLPHTVDVGAEHVVPGAVVHTPDPDRRPGSLPSHTGGFGDAQSRGEPYLDLLVEPGSLDLEGANASAKAAHLAERLGIPATDPDPWSTSPAASFHLFAWDETCTAYGCLDGRRAYLDCNCTLVTVRDREPPPEGIEHAELGGWLNTAQVVFDAEGQALALRTGPWIETDQLRLPDLAERRNETAEALADRNVTFSRLHGPELVTVYPSPKTVIPRAAYAWTIEDGQGGRGPAIDEARSGYGDFVPRLALQDAGTGEVVDVHYEAGRVVDPGYYMPTEHRLWDVEADPTVDLFEDPHRNVTLSTSFSGHWRIDEREIPSDQRVEVPVFLDQATQTTTVTYELSRACCPGTETGRRVLDTRAWLGTDETRPIHLGSDWTVRLDFEGAFTTEPRLAQGEGEISPATISWRSTGPARTTVAFADDTTANALVVALPIRLNVTVDAQLHHLPSGHRWNASIPTTITVESPNATVRHRLEATEKAADVKIFPPPENATVWDEVPIGFSAYDPDSPPGAVDLSIYALDGGDRTPVAEPPLTKRHGSQWSTTWNATEAEPGRYAIVVEVDDGERPVRAERTVVVADPADAPTARIQQPAANDTVGGHVDLRAEAGDGQPPPATVLFTVVRVANGSTHRVAGMEATQVESGLWTGTWNATDLDPGRYRIRLHVNDGGQPSIDRRTVFVGASPPDNETASSNEVPLGELTGIAATALAVIHRARARSPPKP